MISDEICGSETEETLITRVDLSNSQDRHQAVSCSTASASVPKPMLGKKYKADDLLDVVGLKQIPSASIPCI